jgi:hypothetical protein
VAVGWYDEHDAAFELLSSGDGAHRQDASPAQDIGQQAGPSGVEVLGADDGGRKLCRQG